MVVSFHSSIFIHRCHYQLSYSKYLPSRFFHRSIHQYSLLRRTLRSLRESESVTGRQCGAQECYLSIFYFQTTVNIFIRTLYSGNAQYAAVITATAMLLRKLNVFTLSRI